MTFWIVTSLMALAVAGMLALVLLRTRGGGAPAADCDLQVYRDQLSEVERDLARGTIAPADAERVRAEVARRLLAADAARRTAAPEAAGGRLLSGIAAAVVVLGVGAGSLLLYRDLGAPGYGDLGLEQRIETARVLSAARPGQQVAEAQVPAYQPPAGLGEDYLALVARLRETVAARPGDLRGQQLLARHEAALGNFVPAHQAQARVLALKGNAATAGDHATYAETLVLAAGGYVSPEAEEALKQALSRDGGNGVAQYYLGLMLAQNGRPDQAFRLWRRQLAESPPDAGWVAPIRAQIEDVAAQAGVAYTLSPLSAQPGPDAADVAAAGEMSPEDRQTMIRGMVTRLSDRLANEGGVPDDWARLIASLGVLGDLDQARAVYDEAKTAFADNGAALALLAAAAGKAGLAP